MKYKIALTGMFILSYSASIILCPYKWVTWIVVLVVAIIGMAIYWSHCALVALKEAQEEMIKCLYNCLRDTYDMYKTKDDHPDYAMSDFAKIEQWEAKIEDILKHAEHTETL